MRLSAAIAVAVVLAGVVAPAGADKSQIHVAYDVAHLDLDRHVLQFKPSRAVTRRDDQRAIGEDGKELGTGAVSYDNGAGRAGGQSAGPQPADARVMVLQLRVTAADGAATNVAADPVVASRSITRT